MNQLQAESFGSQHRCTGQQNLKEAGEGRKEVLRPPSDTDDRSGLRSEMDAELQGYFLNTECIKCPIIMIITCSVMLKLRCTVHQKYLREKRLITKWKKMFAPYTQLKDERMKNLGGSSCKSIKLTQTDH